MPPLSLHPPPRLQIQNQSESNPPKSRCHHCCSHNRHCPLPIPKWVVVIIHPPSNNSNSNSFILVVHLSRPCWQCHPLLSLIRTPVTATINQRLPAPPQQCHINQEINCTRHHPRQHLWSIWVHRVLELQLWTNNHNNNEHHVIHPRLRKRHHPMITNPSQSLV